MNSCDLAKKWLVLTNPKTRHFNFAKWCGVLQRLLKRYNSDEIKNAMNMYHFYYPLATSILGFESYCKRIIINERRKRVK